MVSMSDCQGILQELVPALSERQVHHILEAVPFADGTIPIERCLLYLHLKYGRFIQPENDFLREALPKLMLAWSGTSLETDQELVSFGERLFKDFPKMDEDKTG